MLFDRLLNRFSTDIGLDLGTGSTLMSLKNKGIVINEPSVVAVNSRTEQIVSIGREASKMLGKTPPYITAVRPLDHGVISDFEITEKMLKYFLDKIYQESFSVFPRPRVVVGVPLDITPVEKKAVEDAVLSAGAKSVLLVQNVVAAAVGAGLNIQDPAGNMIISLGAGLTEIAVLSLSGVVTYKSIPIAGDMLNTDIVQYVREKYSLLIGDKMAESAKQKITNLFDNNEILSMDVQGRDLVTGLPKQVHLTSHNMKEALAISLKKIIAEIKNTLEATPPELIADIYERGIVLSGGGALMKGIDKLISDNIQIPVTITDDPLTCTIRGISLLLENDNLLQEVKIPTSKDESLLP
ncbi:MAG TPA: rod shape-determining protein [bacterium]|nr:rod shape-determining protein [bacterium]